MLLPEAKHQWPSGSIGEAWPGLLIAFSTLILISGCWQGGFTTYDDPMHVSRNAALTQKSLIELFRPEEISSYFPVTLASYKLDRLLFVDWLRLENWARGVRLMSCVYHALAALFVWRIMLRLGLSRLQALFVALAFAVHPLACETVCWISERKNALAGMFGFAALYAWLRLGASRWRVPVAGLLYLLACLSKPSALGLLPVLVCVDLFWKAEGGRDAHGTDALAANSASGTQNNTTRRWLAFFGRLAPFAVISIVVAELNLAGHAATLVAPPGGSVFTALLTDLEILTRYLYNLFIPGSLSAVYFVESIVTPADARAVLCALALAASVAATIFLSSHRRRTIFAWLWLAGALGPNLNLVAIPHFMQDRYLYLSTPAFFLILTDVAAGICARARRELSGARLAGGCAYLAALAVLAGARSPVFESTFTIFRDAVEKQPQAAFARWGLGRAYFQAAEEERRQHSPTSSRAESFDQEGLRQWKIAVEQCPDAKRFTVFSVMAFYAGEDCEARHDLKGAEHYYSLAAFPPTGLYYQEDARASALERLSRLLEKQP